MKIDRIPSRRRAPLYLSVSATCAAALLAGCMGSPTYGTGKTANQQLVEDLTGILSVGPANRGPEIAYTPRGELVKPASLEVLPEPQQELAAAGNPAWPESPEERRRRIRAEATEMGTAHPELAGSGPVGPRGQIEDPERDGAATVTVANRTEIQRRIRENNQGEATSRRYLSEPPLDYRVPTASAPAGELGEDEWKKAREARRANSSGRSWRDFVPWL